MVRAKNLPVTPASVIDNPDKATLRELTSQMPNSRETEFGNLNVHTQVTARSKGSTFIVSDDPERHSDQTITRAEADRVSRMQEEYLATRDVVLIDGFIGNDPEFRTPSRLIMEKSNANIAAMQSSLYFQPTSAELTSFEPELTVIYTPGLVAEGYPEERLITVDLDRYVTRVLNSDYFGESKKGGLRMWNKLVYDRGGLALHAGCKVIPVGDTQRVGLIVGLSGTGKTTTTFTRQNDSRPVQDDFVALMPGGVVHGTENGCFAKTFGLDPKDEPTIHRAVISPEAYLENVSMADNGAIDFFDTSYTQNGRAVFPMSKVEGAADPRDLGPADFLLILNRNDSIIPAVARLQGAQAVAYFMLGETRGTSAGGAAEAGKALRVPGTNPFFPLLHAQQGNRLLELVASCPMEVYLMNTGCVGGGDEDSRSRKVKIQHSSAVVKGIAEGTIEWETDPDFGYEVARGVPDFPAEDFALLQPRRLYAETGRDQEYAALVDKYRRERVEYLRRWPGIAPEIVAAME